MVVENEVSIISASAESRLALVDIFEEALP